MWDLTFSAGQVILVSVDMLSCNLVIRIGLMVIYILYGIFCRHCLCVVLWLSL